MDIPLSIKNEWYALNHYNADGVSDISNADFFLSQNGRDNPNEEYQYFIHEVENYKQMGNASRIACQYPARLRLLEAHTLIFNDVKRPLCDEFIDAMVPEKIQGMSLLFASGFFDNPASYFGHSLIKFNYNKDDKSFVKPDLATINYGAKIPNGDTGITYIIKGLIGAYDASYTPNDTFLNTYHYTNTQLRDMWEYELDLSPYQTQLAAAYAWELRRAKFDYYFLGDNCAHKIIEFIEAISGKKISKGHGFWNMPTQITGQIVTYSDDDGALVKKIHHHKSLETQFLEKFNVLGDDDLTQFKSFFNNEKNIHSISSNVLFLILDYLDISLYKVEKKSRDYDIKYESISKQRQMVLNELFLRSTQDNKIQSIPNDNVLFVGYRPISSLRFGYGQTNSSSYGTLKYRIAHHDLLDRREKRHDFSQFIMGEIDGVFNEDTFDVENITALEIFNIKTNQLPLSIKWDPSWRVRLGYDAPNIFERDYKTAALTTQYGTAHKTFIADTTLYAMGGARVNSKTNDEYDLVNLQFDVGVLADFKDMGRGWVNSKYMINEIDLTHNTANFDIHYAYDIDTSKDVRFHIGTNFKGDNRFGVNIGYYFD